MSDRKLAYIATISQLDKIEGKDRIVYASLKDLGWQVIVDVNAKIGDKIVYVEVDSILPVKPEYEFLRKRCFSEKCDGFIIRGMRMANLISYGIILPAGDYADMPDGYDMTDILGIRKKEDDVPEALPKAKSKFDKFADWLCRKLGIKRKKKSTSSEWLDFAHKTDETRIENLSYLFEEEFKGTPVYSTVKLDGQSATFAVYKGCFYIASRNVCLYCEKIKKAIQELNPKKEKPNMDNFKKVASRYSIPSAISSAFKSNDIKGAFVVQGEICGPGIQKNPMGLAVVDFFVFNLYSTYLSVESYRSWNHIKEFCKAFKMKSVPFIEKRKFDWPDKAALKEYAKGKYENGKDREGVVIRYDSNYEDMPKPLKGMSNMWSFKVVNDDYILGK
jgi:hypothetical protein